MSKKDSWRQNMITCLYSVILLSSREIYSNHNTVLQISASDKSSPASSTPKWQTSWWGGHINAIDFLYFDLMRLIWDCL